MINWAYFPRCDECPKKGVEVVRAFEQVSGEIDSQMKQLSSNAVLAAVGPGLAAAGFRFETGKTAAAKIRIPVLFGNNGKLAKCFDADAYHREAGFVVEVEAGRAVTNNQFLKDLFEACMMHGVSHLAIAVRNAYQSNADFDTVVRFLDTLYASDRLRLPLKGVLVIGY